jgi:hypothetical protein
LAGLLTKTPALQRSVAISAESRASTKAPVRVVVEGSKVRREGPM